jgi:hypothetical protein
MIASIMQPYFFPYIGYLQLLRAADVFVLLDDVQYIKGGWINRNRILLGGKPHWLTFPVEKASLQLRINERSYQASEANRNSILHALANAYRKAPHAEAVLNDAAEIMAFENANVAAFNRNLIERVAERLGIEVRILSSSEMETTPDLRGQDRVIDICRRLGAETYVNSIGGTGLYQADAFAANGIELKFLKARPQPYRQFGDGFVPFLSILDVLMFNAPDEASNLLNAYDFV